METVDVIVKIGYFLICAGVGVLLAFLLIKLERIFDKLDIIDHQIQLDHDRIMQDLTNVETALSVVVKNTNKKGE